MKMRKNIYAFLQEIILWAIILASLSLLVFYNYSKVKEILNSLV